MKLYEWRILFLALCLGLPFPASAQSRPNIRWSAGGHTDAVTAVAYSPDGTLAATASRDTTIKLWHLPDGGLARTFWAKNADFGIAFSPDGSLLASGDGNDVVIRRIADGA